MAYSLRFFLEGPSPGDLLEPRIGEHAFRMNYFEQRLGEHALRMNHFEPRFEEHALRMDHFESNEKNPAFQGLLIEWVMRKAALPGVPLLLIKH